MKDVLYHIQYWSSARILQLIHELDIIDRFEIKTITQEIVRTDPDFISKNPARCLPYFEDADGGFSMIESAAILLYVCEKYDTEHRLSPASVEGNVENREARKRRAEFLTWLIFGPGTMFPILDPVIDEVFFVEESKRDAASIEKGVKKWKKKVAPMLVKRLKDGRKFLCGDNFSAVDCVIGYDLKMAEISGVPGFFDDRLVNEYWDRLKNRESFKKVYPPMNKLS